MRLPPFASSALPFASSERSESRGLLLALGLLAVAGCQTAKPAPETPPIETRREDPPDPPGVLRCVVCREEIRGAYDVLDGKHYHAACYEKHGPRCGVCGGVLRGSFVTLGDKLEYHPRCWEATPRCDGCGLAAGGARGPAAKWKDGRVTCSVCRGEAVTDVNEARKVLADARALMRSALGLDLGALEVPIELVSRPELVEQAKELGQPAIKALTVVREEGPGADGARGARSYRILALYGLPRPALVGILGHELFHVVQCEVSAEERDPALREGSANYVQVALLRARGEDARARLLEKDTDRIYGDGLRRFLRLVKDRGEKSALALGARGIAFPTGY